MAVVLGLGACSSSGVGGPPVTSTGGTSGSGGGAAGGANTCSKGAACGGSVVGTWSVTSSCVAVSGTFDTGAIGLGCPTSPVTGTLQVSGTWTGNPDGTYLDDTTTSGTEQITLDASCRMVSGTTVTCDRLGGANGPLAGLGFTSSTCVSAASGSGCTCSATVEQKGGLGVLSPANASANGFYATVGNTLTIDGATTYATCVAGSTWTVTPQAIGPDTSGTIVFQRISASGTGGSTGAAGRGGTTGTGGATGGTGSTGTGGAVGSGGSAGGGSGGGGRVGSGGRSGAPGSGGTAGITGSGGAPASGGPCDIYQSANTPCVGAYSTVRALYAAYGGSLYQVRNVSGATKDIPVLGPGGFADSSVQDAFCSGACTISILYDESAQHNDLQVSAPVFWLKNGGTASDAKAVKISVGGHAVYGVKFVGGKGNSYRNLKAKGTATGDQPEAIYEVVDSKTYNNQCCNDFGNASTDGNPDGAATMEAIYWGNDTLFGSGGGNGPWILADLEAGTFGGGKADNPNDTPLVTPAFATLMLKGFSGNRYAMKGGDAQVGALITKYDGQRPAGYSPMKKQGSVVLGTGGDGSFYSTGIFFEGAITAGVASDEAIDNAVQSNIVAAGYGK